jgi:hypothetical protein
MKDMVERRCVRLVGCLALAATAGGPALAATPTVQDLHEDCMAAEAYAAAGEGTREAEVRGVRCVSYLEGMAHVLSLNWTDPLSLDGGAAEIRRPGGR